MGYTDTLERSRMQIDTKPKILNRLSRIEGQVRGIARMVDEDRYCIDVNRRLKGTPYRRAIGTPF